MAILREMLTWLIVLGLFGTVSATPKCVWVRGALQCHRDPKKHENVEVRVVDRDGWGFLKVFDPDDLMGVTFTEPDGTFQLDGCGNDFNFLPGIENLPDPFIRIHHFCNGEKGETIELPEFNIFVPDTYDLGILVLDAKMPSNVTLNFPSHTNPRRRLQDKKLPSSVGTTETEPTENRDSKETAEEVVVPLVDIDDPQNTTTRHPMTRPDVPVWEAESVSVSQNGKSDEESDDGDWLSVETSRKERRPNWTKRGGESSEN